MANWIDDPQGREEVEKVTQELKLPILKPNAKGKFRPWLTEVWGKIEDYLINLKNIVNSKEPAITKKSGFNLDKTNLTENDSNKLFTAKGALDLFNTLTTNFTNAVNSAKEYFRTELVKKIDKTSISDSLTSTSTTTVLSSAGAKDLEDKKLNTSDSWKRQAKLIGNTTTPIDLDTIIEAGEYYSSSIRNKWTNLPNGASNYFHLTVESIGTYYKIQTLRSYNNMEFRRISDAWDSWSWSPWVRIDASSINWGNLPDKPSVFPAATHTHSWASLTEKPAFINVVDSTSTTDFATPRSVKLAYDKGVAALTEAQKKENAFAKNTAHNKNFGTTSGTVLEGNKIDQITGKTYGGILNTAGAKTAGKTYFDNNTKKLFLCKNNNSDTSANVANYIALDNNSLLDRLENLSKKYLVERGSNSESWYEIYNDGTLIQGFNSVSADSYGLEYSFIKAFKGTYNIQSTIISNDSRTYHRVYLATATKIGVSTSGNTVDVSILCTGKIS